VRHAASSFPALGTTAAIVVAEPAALAAAALELRRELDAVDRACSRFRPDSELARLNAAAGAELAVGTYLFAALEAALTAAAATDGLVDPTMGRSLRLAGYDRPFARVRLRVGRELRPSFEPAGGWRRVELDPRRRAVRLPAGVELDLGATAKAFAADRAARAAARAAGCGALVSLGGDVAVAGPAPPGGWPIRVADDHAAPLDSPGPVIAVALGGLASSGTALRRWRSHGGELHHLLDPRSGRPAREGWRTVTVAAASCLDANAASTAAVVLAGEAPRWLAERRLPARLVALDGTVTCVGGWPAAAA
jgi:thiamine biosynthesis lipoprotein